MKRLVVIILTATFALGLSSPSAFAGGSGWFATKYDKCSPFVVSGVPVAKLSNWPISTGQRIHYSASWAPLWKPVKVTVEGVRLTNVSEGYANWPNRGTILTVVTTWQNRLYPWVHKSCTNET